MTDQLFPVSPEWAKRAWTDEAKYQAMYRRSVSDPEGFWAEHAARIDRSEEHTSELQSH